MYLCPRKGMNSIPIEGLAFFLDLEAWHLFKQMLWHILMNKSNCQNIGLIFITNQTSRVFQESKWLR